MRATRRDVGSRAGRGRAPRRKPYGICHRGVAAGPEVGMEKGQAEQWGQVFTFAVKDC